MNNKDAIICRCEDITREDIQKCIAAGCRTIDEIKRATRATMGPCQGVTCKMLIAQELSDYYGTPMEEILMPTSRPLRKSVSMGILADAWEETRKELEQGGEDL